MEAIAIPLRRLAEEAAWFARATEVKLLHVTVDATLRGAALKLLMAQEYHADNRALYFRFDDEVAGPTRGWPARAARLREQVAEKTEALRPAGIQLGPLPEPGVTAAAAARGPAAELAALLYEMRRVMAPPVDHVVMVVAPTRVEEPRAFADELAALIRARELGIRVDGAGLGPAESVAGGSGNPPRVPGFNVRWIVVETDGAALAPLARALGAAALRCSCAVDPAGQADALAAMGAASVSEPVAVSALAVTWRAPGAMPDVQPPPRLGAPPPPTDEALRAVGLSPMFIKGGGVALKRLVLGAALALRNGEPADALTLQARAAALCAEMEMPAEQVLNLHVLAGYLLAVGQRARAREVYVQAGDIARARGLGELAAQTELALGMIEVVARAPERAAAHYAAAGRLAEEAKVDVLAIEAWRMAGQLALEMGSRLEMPAIDCWKRALAIAGALDPKMAQATSAAEIARALAGVYRRRGLPAQARAMDQRSVELEDGPAPADAAARTEGAA